MAYVDVVDNEEEESEIHVDYMLNSNTEDDDQEPLPLSLVYFLPQHVTNLNLNEDKSSSDVFYNPYMQLEDGLKLGDRFLTKEDCVSTIKKFQIKHY